MNCLLNASNIHSGGSVQVATSVIGELTLMTTLPPNLVVWASTAVDTNLQKLGYDISILPKYEIVNSYGIRLLSSPLLRRLQNFKVVFTVFGPLYTWRLSGINITGFAQPWILYPNNEIASSLRVHYRWLTRLKFKVQSFFFNQADHLVVELMHVRCGLINKGIGNPSAIHVVRNSLSSLYNNPSKWHEVILPATRSDIKLGFVGRNYAHKNTAILPKVSDLLLRDYGINISFYVTFTEEEWASCSANFRATVINVGPLFVAQCPSFYTQMDGIIFPSLLECFSATPLEAMAMEKLLFASDRPFNRDVCHDHAHYFDPLSPASAAKAIAQVFLSGGPSPEALSAARSHAINFSSPKQRAEKYIALLMQATNKTQCN